MPTELKQLVADFAAFHARIGRQLSEADSQLLADVGEALAGRQQKGKAEKAEIEYFLVWAAALAKHPAGARDFHRLDDDALAAIAAAADYIRWYGDQHSRAGAVKSKAKTAAARANGRKGGRPRKKRD